MLSKDEHDSLTEVFAKIASERIRQLGLLERDIITIDLFSPEHSPMTKLVFPLEELGEVARAIRNMQFQLVSSHRYDPNTENLETELIQLATHVSTWRASLIAHE